MKEWNEIKGNLIKLSKEGNFDVIAHGCNCKKNMGAGIALQIKRYYPLAYQVDLDTISKFGDYSACFDYDECVIINAYTQIFPGKGFGKDSEYNRYNAIKSCMNKINKEFKGKHIGLPLIGCGLAGLKWNKVKKIIKDELSDMKITIVHYDGT